MSLYRETGGRSGRRLAVAALAALAVGLAVGLAIGRSTAPEPSAAAIVRDLRSELQPFAQGLLLVPNEYEQAFRGEGVEDEGVKAAVDRMRASLERALPDLRPLDPESAQQLEVGLKRLEAAIARGDTPDQVGHVVEEVRASLRAAPGGRERAAPAARG